MKFYSPKNISKRFVTLKKKHAVKKPNRNSLNKLKTLSDYVNMCIYRVNVNSPFSAHIIQYIVSRLLVLLMTVLLCFAIAVIAKFD